MSDRCDCGGRLESREPDEYGSGELGCPLCLTDYTRRCNLCPREIVTQEAPALCRWCEGAAKAHARLGAATGETT